MKRRSFLQAAGSLIVASHVPVGMAFKPSYLVELEGVEVWRESDRVWRFSLTDTDRARQLLPACGMRVQENGQTFEVGEPMKVDLRARTYVDVEVTLMQATGNFYMSFENLGISTPFISIAPNDMGDVMKKSYGSPTYNFKFSGIGTSARQRWT